MTAARMGEVLGMTKDEIDWERRVWIVPPSRIKSARPHRVPLVPRALEIIREASAASDKRLRVRRPSPRAARISYGC